MAYFLGGVLRLRVRLVFPSNIVLFKVSAIELAWMVNEADELLSLPQRCKKIGERGTLVP